MRPRLTLTPLEDRLAPAAPDATFGTNGILESVDLVDLPPGTTFDRRLGFGGNDITVRPDGSLTSVRFEDSYSGTTVTRGFTTVRLTPGGTLDTGFASGGEAFTPFPLTVRTADFTEVLSLHPLADGGVLAEVLVVRNVGSVISRTETTYLARFTAAGALDTGYGSGGLATLSDTGKPLDTGRPDFICVAPDGRAVRGGLRDGGQVVVTNVSATGVVGTPVRVDWPVRGGEHDFLVAAALAPDGKLVLGGGTVVSFGNVVGLVLRLNTDGSLDPSFGRGGVFRMQGADNRGLTSLVVLPDGSVVFGAAGGGTGPLDISRLTPAGAPDPGFGGGDGEVFLTPSPGTLAGLVPLPDGRVAAVGAFNFGTGPQSVLGRHAVVMLRPDGALDTSFGTDGTAALFIGLSTAGAVNAQTSVRLAPGGRLLLHYTPLLIAIDLNAPNPADIVPIRLVDATPPDPTVPPFGGPVQTLSSELTGDTGPDRVEVAGPGGAARVRITDGATGKVIVDQTVYEDSFTGGMFAATADLDGDGRAELIVSPDVGGGARVEVFSVVNGALVQRDNYFAIDDPGFRGGARVAAGDVNGDGAVDLVVAAGFGGGPRVAIYDGRGLTRGAAAPPKLVGDFLAFPGADAATLRNGAFVGVGDLDGDGKADLAFGGGPGGGPRVFVLRGDLIATGQIDAAYAAPIANFFVDDDPSSRTGVRLTVADLDNDQQTELAVNLLGRSATQGVRIYWASAVRGSSAPANEGTPAMLAAASPLLGISGD